jgi:hypothetical protein
LDRVLLLAPRILQWCNLQTWLSDKPRIGLSVHSGVDVELQLLSSF